MFLELFVRGFQIQVPLLAFRLSAVAQTSPSLEVTGAEKFFFRALQRVSFYHEALPGASTMKLGEM